jgi:hypothetical protein
MSACWAQRRPHRVVHDVQFTNSDALLGSFSEIAECLATTMSQSWAGTLRSSKRPGAPDPRQDFVTLIVVHSELRVISAGVLRLLAGARERRQRQEEERREAS